MLLKSSAFCILLLLALTVHTQSIPPNNVGIGLSAPPLRVGQWLKGKSAKGFEKGQVYVIEFWATWCGPCLEGMPRLSALARKYRKHVSFIAMNVYERKSLQSIKAYVDSMTRWMNYTVATQDSNYMESLWLEPTGESAIPNAFVVDAMGRIAWIGYPTDLDGVLPRILEDSWNLEVAKNAHESERKRGEIDRETFRAAVKYNDNRYMTQFIGEPDSSLAVINAALAKDTGLKQEYYIPFSILNALLRTNLKKAYEYIRWMMEQKEPNYDAIVGAIKDYPYQTNTLPKAIFELGAEACVAKIAYSPWTLNTPQNYLKTAEWYMRADNAPKAKWALKKALKAYKYKRQNKLLFEKSL